MEEPLELVPESREILRMKVKANGAYEELIVCEDDEPIDLAKEFCIRHGISGEKCLKLALNIQQQIERLIEEEEDQESRRRNVGEELYEKGVEMQKRVLNHIRSEKSLQVQRESKELTFHPSTTPFALKSEELPRYEVLYSRAKAKEQKLHAQRQLASSGPKASLETIMKFSQRMYEDAVKMQEKKKQMIEERDQKIEKEFFNPKVGRAPNRNTEQKRPVKSFQPNFKPSTSSYSNLILNMKKKRAIASLFKMLGPEDGRVCHSRIQFHELPEHIVRIVGPLFEELAKVKQGLTFDDFNVAMENLIRILSPTEKNELLNFNKMNKNDSTVIVKPTKNAPQKIGTLYQRCVKNNAKTKEAIENEREKMLKNEIQKCTFNPKIKFFKPEVSITKKLFEMEKKKAMNPA